MRAVATILSMVGVLVLAAPAGAGLVGTYECTVKVIFTPPGETNPVELEKKFDWELTSSKLLFDWGLGDGVTHDFTAAGITGPVATIEGLSVHLEADPAVSLSFAVTAGVVDTTVVISSPVITFPALVNPDAYATATMTLTDNNSNGATATGQFAGPTSYEATYNGSVNWAHLVGTLTALPDGSAIGNGRQPSPTGRTAINATVSSIQSEYNFVLTAGDSASGTSRFDVVPEPATLALLGFGAALVAMRRRG